MAERFVVRAPGKLILCGEYAVLKGAPCLCLSVARYAYAHVEPAEAFSLTAMGMGPLQVTRSGGDVHFSPAPADAARFELVRQVLLRAPHLPPVHIRLDSSELGTAPTNNGQTLKLGLGSSASAAVALTAALDLVPPTPVTLDRQRTWFERAQHAHLAMQGGRGSGVDVAAASVGGLFVYGRPSARPEDARVEPFPRQGFPLHTVVVWTGQSASTVELLKRMETFEANHPQQAQSRFEHMARVALAAVQAARAHDTSQLIHALHAYGGEMEALGLDAGADIVTAEHRRVRELAQALGCAAKPSGAGGGDIAVALAPSAEVAEELTRAFQREGLVTVSLAADDGGAQWTPSRPDA